MYSVFIVDDEMIVREGLRNKIDWEASGFSFAGEAGDGEMALSMIQDVKPDILITDIRMPFMDGLELAAKAKKMQPWIHIIILSGHDEFTYAKRAISIGVDEYILKPFTLEEIMQCLEKTAQALDEEHTKSLMLPHTQNELEVTVQLARAKLLTDLLYGQAENDSILQALSNTYAIHFSAVCYAVTISEIHAKDDDALNATRTTMFSLEAQEANSIVFQLTATRFAAIIKGSTKESCEDRAFSFAHMALHALTERTDSKKETPAIVTAIGSVVTTIPELSRSYEEALAVIKQSHVTSTNRIVSVADIEEQAGGSIVLQENDPLVDRLNYAGESEIDQIIREYISLLGENTAHFSVIASYLLVDVIIAVSKVIEGLGGDVKKVMPEILTHAFVDRAVESEEQFIREVRRVLTALLAYRNEHVQGRTADIILRAKRYIEKNYKSPDICLRAAAEEVALSPNHFSTVFSQECGVTFIEYLTSVRIEQAKKLLSSTDMKSADIAYDIGFNDPHYFSFIFKKTEGMSPREFRAKAEADSSS